MKNGIMQILVLGFGLTLFATSAQGSAEVVQNVTTFYKTFEVVAVAQDTMTLKTIYRGEDIYATVNRSRRPELKVGDKVRYDNIRNRLGRSVAKGDE
jgi:hypothetical protein